MILQALAKILYLGGYVVGLCYSKLLMRREPTLEELVGCLAAFYGLIGLRTRIVKVNDQVGITKVERCWFYELFDPNYDHSGYNNLYDLCKTLFTFDMGLVRGLGGGSYLHLLTKSLTMGNGCCEFHTKRHIGYV